MEDATLDAFCLDPEEAIRDEANAIGVSYVSYAAHCGAGDTHLRGTALLYFLEQLRVSGLWFRNHHEYIKHSAGLSTEDVVGAIRRLRDVGASGAGGLAATDPVLAPFDLVTREEWRRAYCRRLKRTMDVTMARMWARDHDRLRDAVSEICKSL